jgi:hypothetical protein
MIENSFGSQTRAWAVNVHMALATTQKGNMSVTEYVNKMCGLHDEMASARKPLDDEEMVSYILAGLDIEFNSIVSAVLARVEPISVTELYAQLLSFESCQILLQGANNPSVNAAMHGHGGFSRGHGGGCGYTEGRGTTNCGGHGGGHGGFSYNNNGSKRITYQVWEKEGHMVKN